MKLLISKLNGGPGGSYYGRVSNLFNNTINFENRVDFIEKRRFKKQVDVLLVEEIKKS
jgi:hypothetical protein